MKQLNLYLMLGYPGAGKTTIARKLTAMTGAEHLWADYERRKMFLNPTHSKDESDQLYSHLNHVTEQLLSQGKSVIFDTSFNHFSDRQHLRQIAAKFQAKVTVIWLTTPLEVAKSRAVDPTHAYHNQYEQTMTEAEFNRIVSHFETPGPDEDVIKIDGTNLEATVLETILQDIVFKLRPNH